MRVQVNPAAISSLGLSLEDVRTVLGQANVNAPKGSFDGPRQSFTIGSNDQIFSADAYKPIIVAYRTARRFDSAMLRTSSTAWRTISSPRGSARRRRTARRAARHSAPAGREHHSNCRPREAIAAAIDRHAAAVRARFDSGRSHRDDPRVSARRAIHVATHHRARRDGDVPLPAKILGDGDPERGACRSRSSGRSASCIWPDSASTTFRSWR